MTDPIRGPNAMPAIDRHDRFGFRCGPDVPCFNACCRDLDLLLNPYDVLRLRRALTLASRAFIYKYCEPAVLKANFPAVRLVMNDDGSRSCPFVRPAGCIVYGHRPAACRMYPLGRGASRKSDGGVAEVFVVVRESLCRGFENDQTWTPESWQIAEGVRAYNAMSDRYMKLISHREARRGPLDRQEQNTVFQTLYQPDYWAGVLSTGEIFASMGVTGERRARILQDEEERLRFAFEWLESSLSDDP